ncbi:hypothetical protein OGATHE_000727 [Ogataea polymorpha]|uniref:Uncharacterized protein n=1 Tax=Ogataea polymorpha TaxID=460523 RepID=A0A9P8PUY9_9ASCO|nr:hypothetical protein OGATHE_000727 [Ogataea polymorpha]
MAQCLAEDSSSTSSLSRTPRLLKSWSLGTPGTAYSSSVLRPLIVVVINSETTWISSTGRIGILTEVPETTF